MAAPRELVALIEAYSSSIRRIRSTAIQHVGRTWMTLPSYRDADIARWADQVAPVVEGAQLRTAALTDAYVARFSTLVTGEETAPVGVTVDDVVAVRGVPTAEVYRRMGPTVWTSLSAGDSLSWAVNQGLNRATKMVATDLQLAKTHASRKAVSGDDRIVGHRRVLTGSKSCGKCVVASTQRYHKADLLPIHPGCDCGVQPIYGDGDPGQVIEPDRLDAVHAAIQERFGAAHASAREFTTPTGEALAYRDLLVTHQHGEIGPVLGIRGQHFTGPDDI